MPLHCHDKKIYESRPLEMVDFYTTCHQWTDYPMFSVVSFPKCFDVVLPRSNGRVGATTAACRLRPRQAVETDE
ncbi:hypothetical protein RRG08_065204 [Elysia crispata]|uniref:Uncharacterized protein n=1 Tax=Elysia crispata TaxID=231223 RepID=A0AAE1D1R0_9GAST|nr:hypothetical protein RRG08_065204 [Elysia crispata]